MNTEQKTQLVQNVIDATFPDQMGFDHSRETLRMVLETELAPFAVNPLSAEQEEQRGKQIVRLLRLKAGPQQAYKQYFTTHGGKTALGLYRMIERIYDGDDLFPASEQFTTGKRVWAPMGTDCKFVRVKVGEKAEPHIGNGFYITFNRRCRYVGLSTLEHWDMCKSEGMTHYTEKETLHSIHAHPEIVRHRSGMEIKA